MTVQRTMQRMGCCSMIVAVGAMSLAAQELQRPPEPPAPGIAAITQNPAALAPGAIYKQAMRPLEVVRGSLANWSEPELGALAVGMHQAKEACDRAKPEDYASDDLYDLARLCSFGQDWNAANTAAGRYLDSHAAPHRAQAYAISINALVHLNGVDLAMKTAETMLHDMPYDAEVAYAVRYMKDFLEQAGNPLASKLAVEEHGAMVQALAKGVALKARFGDAVMSVGLLYDSAMDLAYFEKYAGRDEDAEAAKGDCDAALAHAAAIAPEDQQRIDSVRMQYGMVGAGLPQFVVTRALQSATARPAIEGDLGAGTVLVVFPDWCAQCRAMMKTVAEFAKVNASTPLRAYGLMFAVEDKNAGQRPHETNYKDLAGTPTFVVPESSAKNLGALDFPTAVVVDGKGIVRFIGMVPTDAFNGDGYIEKIFVRMTATAAARSGSDSTLN